LTALRKVVKNLNPAKLLIVGLVADRERLIKDVVRLRRAERVRAAQDDVRVVRADLERSVGRTVPRALAARALGVSQTALDRWIKRGDVPAVITPSERREVPLTALVDLILAVEEREGRSDDPHPLASLLRERRMAAAELTAEEILPDRVRRRARDTGHRRAELRGLAYHRVVARRLDQRLVDDARERLRRWASEDRIDPRYLQRWDAILNRSPGSIAKFIGRDDQRGRDLRQSSPFAGALNEHERLRVLEVVG
jgi:hypothetical protein